MTTDEVQRLRRWRGAERVVIPAAIALALGEQIGFFAGLSPGVWPRNAVTAVFFGAFSFHALQLAFGAYGLFHGFMLLVDKYGSRPLGHMLAVAQTIVAKDRFFWIWIVLSLSFLLALVFSSPRAPPVVLLCLLVVFFIVRLIGAIKSPMRQASVLALVALLMGLCWGFYLPDERPHEIDCVGGNELVLRSGERLACITSKVFMRRKFMVVQGPAASTLIRLADVEPASLRRTFSPAAADFLAKLAN